MVDLLTIAHGTRLSFVTETLALISLSCRYSLHLANLNNYGPRSHRDIRRSLCLPYRFTQHVLDLGGRVVRIDESEFCLHGVGVQVK